jgi:ABC-type enterobactin transport system, permease component
MTETTLTRMSLQRRHRNGRRRRVMLALILGLCFMAALTLMLGQSFTPPEDLLRVFSGEVIPGLSFTVMELRLPRALTACLAGASFGLGGVAFQTMLRNPLASPDIIGISTGASTAAVFAIVILSLSGTAVSIAAITGGLTVALLIYLLSWRRGVSGTRLILVGIGLSAMCQSAIAYLLTQAPNWTLQEALRWMTGSLNGATLSQALPLLASLVIFGGALLTRSRDLEALRLGDDMAAGLGVRLSATRVMTILAAVGLVASATAVTGPIAFVAFLAGPISTRLLHRFGARGGSGLIPGALTGALLVIAADYAGQFLLPARYPVGIVTGVLGAPYLIYLIMRDNRSGGTL